MAGRQCAIQAVSGAAVVQEEGTSTGAGLRTNADVNGRSVSLSTPVEDEESWR